VNETTYRLLNVGETVEPTDEYFEEGWRKALTSGFTVEDDTLPIRRALSGRNPEGVAAMEKALEPFAKAADSYDPDEGDSSDVAWAHDFPIGALRNARAALAKYRGEA
jgi:hypothetical protein